MFLMKWLVSALFPISLSKSVIELWASCDDVADVPQSNSSTRYIQIMPVVGEVSCRRITIAVDHRFCDPGGWTCPSMNLHIIAFRECSGTTGEQ